MPHTMETQGCDIMFRFSDSAILRKMKAKDLVKLDIWHGNRILDEEHKEDILKSLNGSIKSLDLKPYNCVTYKLDIINGFIEHKTSIVDGQHRCKILKDYFLANPTAEDFEVLVVEKFCDTESDVIQYFRILNHTKSIQWREDPNMAANRYIHALEAKFNKYKSICIRPGGTRKPYLSSDRLREELVKRHAGLSDKTVEPEEFANRAFDWNTYSLSVIRSDDEKLEKYKKINFILALDDKFKWIDALLKK
jgi:hypothetical protein